MLTTEGCHERRNRLWESLPQEIGWVLIGDARHIQYFSNFRIHPFSFSADQKSLLLLTRDGQTILLADNFAKRSSVFPSFASQEVIVPWYTHRKSVSNRDDALCLALSEVEHIWKGTTGLIEPEGVSEMVAAMVAESAAWQFATEEEAEATTLGDLIRNLRRRKNADEIDLLKACMRACEAGHARALDVIRSGISEFEIFLEVQRAAQDAAGMPCVIYGDFRATNSRIHKAGGHPTHYQLQSGDLFILDYSVVIHGYRSDFTNTIAVGTPAAVVEKQYLACCDALSAASQLLKPGIRCREIWSAASEVLKSRGFGPLAHHAGHGLGLEHPEPPILVSESDDWLVEGDVITLEPGCYIEGQGGMRFEHNFLITAENSLQLSQHRLTLTR